jgi:Mn2+/Fe2+ NRAMP family transporter
MRMSSRERKAVAWVAAAWAVFVVVAAFFQEDVTRALILGLAQEVLLLSATLLVWYLVRRRKSSANETPKP